MSTSIYKRFRGGILFGLVIGALFGAYFAGNWACYRFSVGDKVFAAIPPQNVNLLGIRLAGERIVVSNGIAQLVQDDSAGFGRAETGGEPVGASGAKIPMAALVGSLQGNPDGVEELVMSLNRIEHQILPDESLTWNASDIRRALDGDAAMRKRLESDLNTTLEGEPADTISRQLTFTGIWIRLPIAVEVPSAEGSKRVESSITLPYVTELVRKVQAHPLVREKFEVDPRTLALVYEEVWQESAGGFKVRQSLESFIAPDRLDALSGSATRLLSRVTVLVTEDLLQGAGLEVVAKADGKGDSYTINLNLERDGRDRLWQYTRRNPGCQLLFTVDGIAIAAPVVQHEMMYYTAAITNIQEEDLARQAVDLINRTHASKP